MPIDVKCEHSEQVDPKKLLDHPGNPNKHPRKQVELLAKSIEEYGWRHPIVVSRRSGYIVAGHGRKAAALNLGCSTVPVDYQDFKSDEEELAVLLADNILPELATMDDTLLEAGKFTLLEAGFELESIGVPELEPYQEPNTEIDAEPKIDRAAELQEKWGTKRGQLWGLGEHRLLCGDSTSKDDVEKLLASQMPGIMVTDPPYGVNYDANWRNDALRENGKPIGGRAVGKVNNDDRADWSDAWNLFQGDVAYVWHGGVQADIVKGSLETCGLNVRQQIVWNKNQLVIGRSAYQPKHEPCWYCVRKGKKANWIGGRKQTTVWEINKPNKSETGHSTQKPVECMRIPLQNHDFDSVYDPFLGSGTTMIAAEQTGRKCFGMEIDPNYCAVILERFFDATGKEPVLLS